MSTHISRNIFWLSLSRVVALGLLALAYFALFRYLGPTASGQYQFVLSYVLLFSTVVDFGIQQFITKKISEQPDRTQNYFENFLSFEVLLAGMLYVLLVALAFFRHDGSEVLAAIMVCGLGMAANALTYPYLAVMAAYQDLKKVAFINFVNSLVNVSVIFAAIFFHRHIVFLSSVQLIFGVLDLFLYRHFSRKYLPTVKFFAAAVKFDWSLIKSILKQGWPFTLLVGFSAIYNRIDVILITALKGYTQTGYYTAAYKLFDLLGFFPAVVSYTLFPFFTGLMAKRAVEEVKYNLEKYLRLMVAAALPMAVGGMVLSKGLIGLVAGPGFEQAAPVLAILIWAPAILFIYIPLNSLVISQLTKKAMIITGANVVVNTLGNLLLIPHFGIRAAAIMTVISESLQGIFYFYFVKQNITSFSFWPGVYKPALASLIMGLVLWWLRQTSLILGLAVGAVVYGLVLLATGFFKKEDLATLVGLFKSKAA